jgi:hypothetical protein
VVEARIECDKELRLWISSLGLVKLLSDNVCSRQLFCATWSQCPTPPCQSSSISVGCKTPLITGFSLRPSLRGLGQFGFHCNPAHSTHGTTRPALNPPRLGKSERYTYRWAFCLQRLPHSTFDFLGSLTCQVRGGCSWPHWLSLCYCDQQCVR